MPEIEMEAHRPLFRGSLRLYLGLVTVVLLTVLSATLVGIAYVRARSVAIEHVQDNMRNFADRLAGRLEALSGNTAGLVGMVASIPNAFLANADKRVADKFTALRQVMAHSPGIESVYAGYPDGSFFQVIDLTDSTWRKVLGGPPEAALAVRLLAATADKQHTLHVLYFDHAGRPLPGDNSAPSNFDPRQRAWYRNAIDKAAPIATGPYEMATTGALGVTVSQAHIGNSRIVIGADVILQRLTDFFAKEKISASSEAFLIDGDGKLVLHSDPRMNSRIIASRDERDFDPSTLSDPLLTQLKANPPVLGQTSFPVVDGRTFLVMVAPIPSQVLFGGDKLVIAAPLDELMFTADRDLLQGLGIAAAVVGLAIVCALLLAHLITKSLHRLTESARRFQNLDFKTPIKVESRVREISMLGAAMNRARDAIFTFTLYVPKELVQKGMQSGEFSGRSARRQEVTALFTDIYDFTTISEQHAPEEVVAMLSEYFDILNDCVEANGGTIIQFLGDSIFAMWNAPIADPEHAEHACHAARAISLQLKIFNARQKDRNLPEFRTRCGIHTGPAVVGSVGATDRLQYTAMGDTINVASRLEGMNKTYGTSILASADVVAQCTDRSMFRSLGQATARGRAGALEVFEIVAD